MFIPTTPVYSDTRKEYVIDKLSVCENILDWIILMCLFPPLLLLLQVFDESVEANRNAPRSLGTTAADRNENEVGPDFFINFLRLLGEYGGAMNITIIDTLNQVMYNCTVYTRRGQGVFPSLCGVLIKQLIGYQTWLQDWTEWLAIYQSLLVSATVRIFDQLLGWRL